MYISIINQDIARSLLAQNYNNISSGSHKTSSVGEPSHDALKFVVLQLPLQSFVITLKKIQMSQYNLPDVLNISK